MGPASQDPLCRFPWRFRLLLFINHSYQFKCLKLQPNGWHCTVSFSIARRVRSSNSALIFFNDINDIPHSKVCGRLNLAPLMHSTPKSKVSRDGVSLTHGNLALPTVPSKWNLIRLKSPRFIIQLSKCDGMRWSIKVAIHELLMSTLPCLHHWPQGGKDHWFQANAIKTWSGVHWSGCWCP